MNHMFQALPNAEITLCSAQRVWLSSSAAPVWEMHIFPSGSGCSGCGAFAPVTAEPFESSKDGGDDEESPSKGTFVSNSSHWLANFLL